MRVITGTARGRKLLTLEGLDTRPTAERVKEAVFSAMQFEVEGRRVLDLFAGSGQMGIEALSRGAKSAVFVDNSSDASDIIKKNLQSTGLSGNAKVVCGEALAYITGCRESFDLIFLDPPYSKNIPDRILEPLSKLISPYATVICEHDHNDVMPQKAGSLEAVRTKKYGRMAVTYYRTGEPANE